MDSYGILSLLPAFTALTLAFITREVMFSLLIGIFVGILITGQNLLTGFTSVTQEALGNADFIWVLTIQVFVGIMIAFFQKSGATAAFTRFINKRNINQVGAQVSAWLLGIFIFFSDSFSPLYVGTVMKDVTDKARVSREKLAYIADSTSSPLITLVPFTSWGVYMGGLLIGIGAFVNNEVAMNAVIRSVPYNFYGILSISMVGLIAFKIIPDFGPMKKAEDRARETGKVIGDKAKPLVGKDIEDIKPKEGIEGNLLINFIAPALIVLSVSIGTHFVLGSVKILEGFVLAVAFQFIVMLIQRMGSITELMDAALMGVKGVFPAIFILALAYCLNTLTGQLGTAEYVLSVTEGWMTGSLLLAFTFALGAFVSFFTGSSWGTYAIITPIVIPLAFYITGGEINSIVFATIAAVFGGGAFGDHSSPLSDTSILASLGSGSDHLDHIKTQAPYALVVGGVSTALYLIIGLII